MERLMEEALIWFRMPFPDRQGYSWIPAQLLKKVSILLHLKVISYH